MKILTLNIWRYFDWEKRKSNLIKFLKKENADIVFLQEAAFDDRLKWDNQVQEINFELNYKSKAFCKLREMTFWNNVPIDWIMYYGQGFLTKYPIIKTQEVLLKPVLKEQGLGFLYVQVKTPEGKLDLINVHFENTDLVTFRQAVQLTKMITESFLAGELGEVYLVYPQFISTLKQEAKKVKLLPISLENIETVSTKEFLFEPNADELLDFILIHQVEEQIYQALLETKASEHSARMVAMKNATDNAKDLVEDLQLNYNQTRQDAITREILEIASASAAMS